MPVPEQPTEQKIVCVLGMHRSGTSLTAGLLDALGVFMGREESLTEKRPDNPNGFWELSDVWRANDQIFATLGGAWHEPPVLASGWECQPILGPILDRARALIAEEFGGKTLWGWKDPRTCLTLPFWERLVSPTHYVLCMRNPIDVWRSLEERDGFAFDKAVGLWLAYVISALESTASKNRLIIWYEDLLAEPDREIDRLSEFLGLPASASRADSIDRALQPSLRHHHASFGEVIADPRLPLAARTICSLMWPHAEDDFRFIESCQPAPGTTGDNGSRPGGESEAGVDLIAQAAPAEGDTPEAADITANYLQVFWCDGDGFSQDRSVGGDVVADGQPRQYEIQIPSEATGILRIDPGWKPAFWKIHRLTIAQSHDLPLEHPALGLWSGQNNFEGLMAGRGIRLLGCSESYDFICEDEDPQLLLSLPAERPEEGPLTLELSASVINLDAMAQELATETSRLQDALATITRDHHLALTEIDALRKDLSDARESISEIKAKLARHQELSAELQRTLDLERQRLEQNLRDAEAELKAIKSTRAWALATRYGRFKHGYLLPLLRKLGRKQFAGSPGSEPPS
jgi:hypothetical protein